MKKATFATPERMALAVVFLKQWYGLDWERRCSAVEWLQVKFSCTSAQAQALYDTTRHTPGR